MAELKRAGQALTADDRADIRRDLGLGTAAVESASGLRDRSTHTGSQPIGSVTGLQAALDAKADTSAVGAALAGKADTTDARLSDAREWTAATVLQAEAEAGTATTRRAWTAERVRQAIVAWWTGSADKTKLDGIQAGATANSTDAQLRDRGTHTGTQAISTVTGLQTAIDAKADTSAVAAALAGKADTTDARLSDAREWTAATVLQAEAEAGTATTRRAWTAERVRQAIVAWWAGSADKTKLDGIAAGATANATNAQLRDRSTHTGTQAASTVTMATARLLGRTTAGAGAAEEIAVGSGLSLAAGTLSATGGGSLPTGITSPGDGALAAAAGTLTASRPSWDATQTWNASGVTFTGWRMNITDTASATVSWLMDLQVGGVTRFRIRKDGRVIDQFGGYFGFGLSGYGMFEAEVGFRIGNGSGGAYDNTRLVFPSTASIEWSATANAVAGSDAILRRDGPGAIAQRNGTAAQEKRVYGTFTDASNHRRVSMGMSTAGVGFLRPEGAGTGASGNVLHISGLPTSNPGPGILWNDAGTVRVGT